MIDVAVIFISGFSQGERERSGLEVLFQVVLDTFRTPSDGVCVYPFNPVPWNHDFDGYAARIDRLLSPAGRVVLIPYSWGGGNGMPKLAQALADHRRRVRAVVGSDMVHNSGVWGHRYLAWLLRYKTVPVPANVDEVWWFRQSTNVPAGHDVVAADPARTHVHDAINIRGLTHSEMDEAMWFHQKAIEVVGEVARELSAMVRTRGALPGGTGAL